MPDSRQARYLISDFSFNKNFIQYGWHQGNNLPSSSSVVFSNGRNLALYLTNNIESRWRWEVMAEPDNFSSASNSYLNSNYNTNSNHESSRNHNNLQLIQDRLSKIDPNLLNEKDRQNYYDQMELLRNPRRVDLGTANSGYYTVMLIDETDSHILCADHNDEFHLQIADLQDTNIVQEKYCHFKLHYFSDDYFTLELKHLNSRKISPVQSHFLAVDFARIHMKQMTIYEAEQRIDTSILWKWSDSEELLLKSEFSKYDRLPSPPCQSSLYAPPVHRSPMPVIQQREEEPRVILQLDQPEEINLVQKIKPEPETVEPAVQKPKSRLKKRRRQCLKYDIHRNCLRYRRRKLSKKLRTQKTSNQSNEPTSIVSPFPKLELINQNKTQTHIDSETQNLPTKDQKKSVSDIQNSDNQEINLKIYNSPQSPVKFDPKMILPSDKPLEVSPFPPVDSNNFNTKTKIKNEINSEPSDSLTSYTKNKSRRPKKKRNRRKKCRGRKAERKACQAKRKLEKLQNKKLRQQQRGQKVIHNGNSLNSHTHDHNSPQQLQNNSSKNKSKNSVVIQSPRDMMGTPCSKKWVHEKGWCYRAFSKKLRNFRAADKFCRKKYGSEILIPDTEELTYFTSWLAANHIYWRFFVKKCAKICD